MLLIARNHHKLNVAAVAMVCTLTFLHFLMKMANISQSVGHFAKDCPEAPPPMTCRNCGEEGHKAQDCPNERVMICRNCDKPGHMSRDCPEPKDWSKHTCRNCGEKGHGPKRCPQPPKEDDGGFGRSDSGFGEGNFGDSAAADTTGGKTGGWDTAEAPAAEPTGESGGWKGDGDLAGAW